MSTAWVDDTNALRELGQIVEWRLADALENDISLARREFMDMASWAPILVNNDWKDENPETDEEGRDIEDVTLRLSPGEAISAGVDRNGEEIGVRADELPAPVPWPWRRAA